MQGKDKDPAQLSPPWRAIEPTGELGAEYGPCPATYARQIAEHRDWSYRPHRVDPRVQAMIAWMRLPDGSIRSDVPEAERQVYALVFEQGMTQREAARARGLSRSSVKVYLRRLERRAREAREKP